MEREAETASRLRGRIERVLDAAKAQGLRSGENPARWRGHLDQLLPKRQRLTRGHHAAMRYADVPAFMVDLQARQATAAAGAGIYDPDGRSIGRDAAGERREEFDVDRAVWTVPADTDEGRPRTPRAAVSARAQNREAGDARLVPTAISVPWPEARQAAVGDGARNDAPPHEGGGRDGARLPLHLPRLGGRVHEFHQ